MRKRIPNSEEDNLIVKILDVTSLKMNLSEGLYENNRRSFCSRFTFSIVILCIISYFIHESKSDESDYISSNYFIYDPTKKIQLWRFFTYSFVHQG
jgi:membrane associated rhomboid family serine protease